MLIQVGEREKAIRVLINVWLRDQKMSCAYCGREKDFNRCEDCRGVDVPLATNKQILNGFTEELTTLRETRKNKYASTEKKDLRFALSMPVGLYNFLDRAFKRIYNESLFTKEYDVNWFLKKFGRYFGVPQER